MRKRFNPVGRVFKSPGIVENHDSIVQWSYSLAKNYAISNLVKNGVTSARKYDQFKKSNNLPKHFPKTPDEYFERRGTWKGWRDFLGNSSSRRRSNFLSYTDASRIAKINNIKNSVDYRNWVNRPANMPARPELQFKNQWTGWEKFLGKNYGITMPRNNVKLSTTDVRIIKHQLSMGVSGAVLAKSFNVSEMQISRIKKGTNWSDI